MIEWIHSGEYLERGIQVGILDDLNCALPAGSMSESLVMVCLGVPFPDDASSRQFVSMLIATSPLAIVFYGHDAERAFDILISLLTEDGPRTHIMTKYIKEQPVDEALGTFLKAIWPSEERFDDWKNYSVLVTGEFKASEIIGIIKAVID